MYGEIVFVVINVKLLVKFEFILKGRIIKILIFVLLFVLFMFLDEFVLLSWVEILIEMFVSVFKFELKFWILSVFKNELLIDIFVELFCVLNELLKFIIVVDILFVEIIILIINIVLRSFFIVIFLNFYCWIMC